MCNAFSFFVIMNAGDFMNIIDDIKRKAKSNKKVIVLPESEDERVVQAAIKAQGEGVAQIILIGDENEIKQKYTSFDFLDIKFILPSTSFYTEEFINKFYEMRKGKGVTLEEATNTIKNDYNYFACMLVNEGYADGGVSGASHSTSDTLRPALQIIKTKEGVAKASSFFLMDVPNTSYGEEGVFIFSDAGLNQNPTSEELADIAYSSSVSFELLTGKKAKVAFLSHSTKGSAKHEDVDKVVNAFNITKNKYPFILCDGELQLDAAIVPEVAKSKAKDSLVAGYANTLIFPNLDSGNIGYKLVERLAKAEAYGPITQGLRKPINDLSRGCSVDDIVGVIAITVLQTQEF